MRVIQFLINLYMFYQITTLVSLTGGRNGNLAKGLFKKPFCHDLSHALAYFYEFSCKLLIRYKLMHKTQFRGSHTSVNSRDFYMLFSSLTKKFPGKGYIKTLDFAGLFGKNLTKLSIILCKF